MILSVEVSGMLTGESGRSRKYSRLARAVTARNQTPTQKTVLMKAMESIFEE